MSAETNRAAVRRYFDGFNTNDPTVVDDVVASNFVSVDPSTPGIPNGPDGARKIFSLYRSAFPDLNVAIEDLIAEGDTVVARWTAVGTHQGELLGVPPTNIVGHATGMSLFHLENGKVTEAAVNWDALGLLQQLGVIPTGEK